MVRRTAAARRAGFTLIEVLIVIAIMSILMALLLVGVGAARRAARRTAVVDEVNKLGTSVTAFKKEFNFYPPTEFRIPEKAYPSTATASVDVQSYRLMRRMFPRFQIFSAATCNANEEIVGDTTVGGTAVPAAGMTFYFPKYGPTGSEIQQLDNHGTLLTGVDSLAYFLGGSRPAFPGWHPAMPVYPTGSTKKGPYFDFAPDRFAGNAFLDPFKTPYAYMASGASGYPTSVTVVTASGNQTVSPYKLAASRFVNPDSFQLISAGQDLTFGPGDVWAAGTGAYAPTGVGADDIANFNGAPLGVNPNQGQ
jgi:prepilin-type N-terminal cleavage/methylation domain-containing protein